MSLLRGIPDNISDDTEIILIQEHLIAGDYENWYSTHLDNTLYRPLIKQIIEMGQND